MKKIGFSYNLKDPSTAGTDQHAEYETPETIEAITSVLSSFGTVVDLPFDGQFIGRILREQPDCVFNIAEGWGGRDRESFVPAVCGMLGIPHTGSDAVTLGITMDKALTKRIARDAGIRTAEFIVYTAAPKTPAASECQRDERPAFGFPAFVKPAWDGSSRGIDRDSLVHDMQSLSDRVRVITTRYGQPALVEPYLDGRDFCVALLGNEPPQVLRTCEVLLGHEEGIPFFSFEYKRRDTDRLDMSPDVPDTTVREMENAALRLWDILGCRDCARFDFRTDNDGIPYLLEVNALPGLSPVSGILVKQAEASGIPFNRLIETIMERIMG